MDLRSYFRKIREVESTIADVHTFVSSLETPDGGRAGQITEVTRDMAAKMIIEGRAVLATKSERDDFLKKQAATRAAAQRADLAQKLQVTIVSDGETLHTVQPTNGLSGKK